MKRNSFSLSHYHLSTCDLGQLVPIAMVPVLPGDLVGHHANVMARVTPLVAPVMHQVDLRVHTFYASNRILDDGWEDFITGGADGMDTSQVPTINTTGTAKDLLDYLGIPPGAGSGIAINANPITMYNRIWNTYYRDQDLGTERADGDVTVARCAWEKDYFTVARPWAEKGPTLSIPLGSTANIVYPGNIAGNTVAVQSQADDGFDALNASNSNLQYTNTTALEADRLMADLANATGASPRDVRRIWGLQRWAEHAAMYGNRYPEKMRQLGSSYKGQMDRPVYLGGGTSPLNFSEVLQTAEGAVADVGVGDMYGHGIAAMRSNRYAYMVPEHGYIMTLLSVRPKAVYMDGVHREWLKQDREDFHDPFLEFIGHQEVWDGEIALTGTDDRDTFGYSFKYEEYQGHPSLVTGEFRDTLDYWHLARDFSNSKQTLNEAFVTCTPSKRVFQQSTANSLWVLSHHNMRAMRNVARNPMPRLL